LTRAITLEPNPIHYYHRGLARIELADPAGAEDDLDRAIELGIDSSSAYVNRGLIRGLRNAHRQAEADFSKAIALGDDSAITRNNRSRARYQSGDFEGAAADVDELIKDDPASAILYHMRGEVRFAQERWASAIADLTRAWVLSDGGDFEARRLRGIASLTLDDCQKAEDDFTAVLDSSASHPELLILRGLARLRQDKDDRAEEDFSAALPAGGQQDRVLHLRGIARIKQNRWRAHVDLDKAIKLNPHLRNAVFDRAVLSIRHQVLDEQQQLLISAASLQLGT
jgi:tetratricopeptide (TPR) repeat protein